MICNPYAQHEVHCDDFGRAMSPQVSCLGHKMSDDRESLGRHKQSKVLSQVFRFVKHIEQRFWQLLLICLFCTELLIVCLFQTVYIVSLFLDTVFLSVLSLFQKVFFFELLCKCFDKNDKYLSARQPFLYAVESRIMALFRYICDKFLYSYNAFKEVMETSIPC